MLQALNYRTGDCYPINICDLSNSGVVRNSTFKFALEVYEMLIVAVTNR